MLLASPQLVGYVSELPRSPGHVLHQDRDGPVDPADPQRRRHGAAHSRTSACTASRRSPTAAGPRAGSPVRTTRGTTISTATWSGCPARKASPKARSGTAKLTELPATECAGFLWISLEPRRDARHPRRSSGRSPTNWTPGASAAGRRWARRCSTAPINWKLAIDTFAENYHFATVHKTTFATIARSNCTVFDSFGPHHRLVFPLNGILDLEDVPRRAVGAAAGHGRHLRVVPEHRAVVRRSPTASCSASIPSDVPGRSITVHQNSTPLDLSEESVAAGAAGGLRLRACAPSATRTTRSSRAYRPTWSQASREHLVFGRNEPGLQHRHATWTSRRSTLLVDESALSSIASSRPGLGGLQHVDQLPVPVQRQRPFVEREAAHRLSAQRAADTGTGPPCTPAAGRGRGREPTAPPSSPDRACATSGGAGRACIAPPTAAGPACGPTSGQRT